MSCRGWKFKWDTLSASAWKRHVSTSPSNPSQLTDLLRYLTEVAQVILTKLCIEMLKFTRIAGNKQVDFRAEFLAVNVLRRVSINDTATGHFCVCNANWDIIKTGSTVPVFSQLPLSYNTNFNDFITFSTCLIGCDWNYKRNEICRALALILLMKFSWKG